MAEQKFESIGICELKMFTKLVKKIYRKIVVLIERSRDRDESDMTDTGQDRYLCIIGSKPKCVGMRTSDYVSNTEIMYALFLNSN